MAISVAFFDIGATLVGPDRSWVPGAKSCLSELRASGLRLGVISNTSDLSREEVEGLMPPGFSFGEFASELVVLSSEVGIEKPDPGIFVLAVGRANVSAENAVFVGENLDESWAAQGVGMRSVRLSDPPVDFERLVVLSRA